MHNKSSDCSLKVTFLIVFFLLLSALQTTAATARELIIIGDNGAGEQLVKHSLPAVTLAASGDIDYIALPVVMTADNQLIVFRELTLNHHTDVAKLFPGRSHDDGSYNVIDFTLAEIRQLRLKNRFDTDSSQLSFAIPTLREELSLIRRLESILNKQIGISLEPKHPWFHLNKGKDISSASLDILADYSYVDADSKIFVQCFDPEELQRIHDKLLPEKQLNLPLIQLIGNNDGLETRQENSGKFSPYSYDWLYTNSGLKIVSSYAAVIALPDNKVTDENGTLLLTDYITSAHENGLKVFIYPFTRQNQPPPPSTTTFSARHSFYLGNVDLDGLYTDSSIYTSSEIQL